jgi:hypothetical protein
VISNTGKGFPGRLTLALEYCEMPGKKLSTLKMVTIASTPVSNIVSHRSSANCKLCNWYNKTLPVKFPDGFISLEYTSSPDTGYRTCVERKRIRGDWTRTLASPAFSGWIQNPKAD